MRVNMDSSVVSDPRFKLLGKKLGVSWREALGSCFLVWLACYERRSEVLTVCEIDIAAEREGFAESMVSIGLAEIEANASRTAQAGCEPDVRNVLVHGVRERISFLENQRTRGAAGGKRSGKSRQSKVVVDEAANEANASRTAQAYSPAPAPAPAPSLTLSEPVSRSEPFDPEEDRLRKSEWNRKEFEAEWNAAGMRPLKRLTHTLHERLNALMADGHWQECWRDALKLAGKIPFFAKGVGRRNGPLDPSEFLKDDDFAASILRGKYGQEHGAHPAEPTKYMDPNADCFNAPCDPMPLVKSRSAA